MWNGLQQGSQRWLTPCPSTPVKWPLPPALPTACSYLIPGFSCLPQYYKTWIERLASWGYAVVTVRNWGPRGGVDRGVFMRMAGRAYAIMVAAAVPATHIKCRFCINSRADRTATHLPLLLQYDRPLGGLFQPTAETELSYFEAIMGCVGATASGCSHAKSEAVCMSPNFLPA